MTRRNFQNISTAVTLLLIIWLRSCQAAERNRSAMILRIRLEDGSIEKVQIAPGAADTLTLSQVLTKYAPSKDATIKIGDQAVSSSSVSLSSLGLKHGSLISVVGKRSKIQPAFSIRSNQANRFQPFPDLAKNYEQARRHTARKRKGGLSYGDLAHLQSSLHIVEPQPQGKLKRVYMCQGGAERFHSNCLVQKKGSKPVVQNRIGLLLGTIQRERVNPRPKKTRTSLSSSPSSDDFCLAARVHAIWEPPQSPSTGDDSYDPFYILHDSETLMRVLKMAKQLDLIPVGWIYTYSEDRHETDDALPVWGKDVICGAKLQIREMEKRGREEGSRFVTLSMASKDGATEAFQLSDVSVQMVSEGMLGTENGRYVSTKHEILVDGREVTQLDSVLCLINTALITHQGLLPGSNTNTIKKTGGLTTSARKRLIAAIDAKEDSDSQILDFLCDFNVLVALDALLSSEESQSLLRVVLKWSKGQKQGTSVTPTMKRVLKTLLST